MIINLIYSWIPFPKKVHNWLGKGIWIMTSISLEKKEEKKEDGLDS